MALTPSERKLRASIAGLTAWANTDDRQARAAHASRGNWQKCYDATDPSLPEHVRAAQANSAYKAHMKRLAFLSSKAARQRKEAQAKLAAERRAGRQAEQLVELDVSADTAVKAARAARRRAARARRKAARQAQQQLDGGAA